MSEVKTNNSQPGGSPGALIYVVDDEPMLLELATIILEPQGYRILTFRDPELALQHYSTSQPRPDLLITDYAMHTMNGMQLIEKFRTMEPRQKILLVSGTVGEDIYQDSPYRPDQFLAKPYQSEQLTATVKKMLGAR
jgi:CheY-like chemotaxis protein